MTYYTEEYERNNARIKSKKGKMFKAKRSSTVEPVFGVLTQFRSLRKINTIGIKQANKAMHLSAIAYNLKKYLKFTTPKVQENKKEVLAIINWIFRPIQLHFKPF
ncbi:transposase [bacterium SCSIO 12643]|nr:transposase [bacterium SCSIO 12643]